MEIKTENYTGADCTGSNGASNRTLTLSNTNTTSTNGFLVYASGLALGLTTEYTVVHASSGTVITFLNPLYDDMTVVVQYVQLESPTDDFINGPLADFGVIVTRTPVTMTTDFHGNKTYTDGSTEDIYVVFSNPNTQYNLDKGGLNKVYDAIMYVKSTQTINKYDKITHNSKIYRVDTVSNRNFDGSTSFKTVTLFYIQDE